MTLKDCQDREKRKRQKRQAGSEQTEQPPLNQLCFGRHFGGLRINEFEEQTVIDCDLLLAAFQKINLLLVKSSNAGQDHAQAIVKR